MLHRPAAPTGEALVLAHGAGSNCNAPLLAGMARAFAGAGCLVLRYDLPFRVQRPTGPPFPAQAGLDREGVERAAEAIRRLAGGRVFGGGHSYGGRQTAMLAAEKPDLFAGLLLLSYPLHPPGRPDRMRTAFFPGLRAPHSVRPRLEGPLRLPGGTARSDGRNPGLDGALPDRWRRP